MASTDQNLPLKLQVATTYRSLGYTAFTEVDLCTYSYREVYNQRAQGKPERPPQPFQT